MVPVHFEGWAGFSKFREIDRAFAAAGLRDRLRRPPAGQPVHLLAS
jgi:hypothetical protein